MPIVTFNMADVGKLINELKGCQELSPTMDDLFDSNKHKDGVIRNDAGLTEEQADAQKIPFWPSAKSIDPSKLEPVLQLVGDHGVYLITNAKLEGTPSSRGTVVYAKGCNPAVDEDFYEEKERVFGGSDGSISIPLAWAELAQKKGVGMFKIQLNKNSIKLLS